MRIPTTLTLSDATRRMRPLGCSHRAADQPDYLLANVTETCLGIDGQAVAHRQPHQARQDLDHLLASPSNSRTAVGSMLCLWGPT